MSGHDDFGKDAAALAPGERLVWQGKPSIQSLALRAFHVRAVAIYFAIVMAARMLAQTLSGTSFADALQGTLWLLAPAACGIAMLTGLAYLFVRAANYTLTDRRLIFQFGVALPMTMTIPLEKIANAALKTYRDGSGDIPLKLTEDRGSFLLLWPHVRPWKLRGAEPMLRCVPDAANVASLISEALKARGVAAAPAVSPSRSVERHEAPAHAASAAA